MKQSELRQLIKEEMKNQQLNEGTGLDRQQVHEMIMDFRSIEAALDNYKTDTQYNRTAMAKKELEKVYTLLKGIGGQIRKQLPKIKNELDTIIT
jgi:hypothetical protein